MSQCSIYVSFYWTGDHPLLQRHGRLTEVTPLDYIIIENSAPLPRYYRHAEVLNLVVQTENEEDIYLSCPWCYSKQTIVSKIDDTFFVLCISCNARGPRQDTITNAWKAWNQTVKGDRS
jgi:hypothetical protein